MAAGPPPIPAVKPRPAAAPSLDLVWRLCLAIVRCRRDGGWPAQPGHHVEAAGALQPAAAARAALAWTPTGGWALHGDWDAEALEFFALYKPLLDRPPGAAPWLIAQLGQSLDGCVATADGDSFFVTGPQSLLHLHRLRALSDAVIVGAGTVAADDPQLTTRRVPGEHAVRVVIDPARGLSPGARVFSDGQAPTLRLIDADHPEPAAADGQCVAVPGLRGADGTLAPAAVVAALRARGLALLFVEGGGVTVSRFLAAGCLDRLHLMSAPLLIGAGRPGLQLPPAASLDAALRPPSRVFRLGDDVLWDLDLAATRRPLTAPR